MLNAAGGRDTGHLKRLVRMGALMEIAPDHFFLRETVAEMARSRPIRSMQMAC